MCSEEICRDKIRNRDTRQKKDGSLDQRGSSRGGQNLLMEQTVEREKNRSQ